MKFYIELTKKEISTGIEAGTGLIETDAEKLEFFDEANKAVAKNVYIRNDVMVIDYNDGLLQCYVDERMVCKMIKKTAFLVVGLKSVLKATCEMFKSWAVGMAATFSDQGNMGRDACSGGLHILGRV